MKNRVLWLLLAVCVAASLLVFPTASAKENTMVLPATGEDMRQLVVEHAVALSEVEWKCVADIDFTNAVSWSPNLYYEAGVTYRGIPYTSDTIAGNADIEEFTAMLNENGEYAGPVSWNELPGSDCGGQVRLAYGWAGVLCDLELEELVFDPGEESQSFGLIPLGGYDYSGYSRSNSTHNTVLVPNGEQTIYECYAQLKAGDCVYVIYPDGGEHVMLAIGTANVQRDGSGNVLPDQSTVPILELTSGIHDKGAYKSNWSGGDYSFRWLYETGFIPLTMEAFSKESVDVPTFEIVDIEISGQVGFHDLMSGRVVSNYNIFNLYATVTDAQGNVVIDAISYPNSLRADLSELDYGAELVALPAGNYHYNLTAKIGFGEITIVDTDITYDGCEAAPVVYISDNGTGNGSSPDAALGNAKGYENISMTSYKDSALHRALTMLADTGGTVVICEDVTLISGRNLSRYTNNLSCFSSPLEYSDQIVNLTSKYDGVDYRKQSGAELIMQRSGTQAVDLELNIGTVWSEMDFRTDYNYAMLPPITQSTIGAFVTCGRTKTVIESTVTSAVSHGGELLDVKKYSDYFPKLYGGYYNLCAAGNTDLTVLGGSWDAVVGGNYKGYLFGGANVTVGGEAVVYNGVSGGNSDNEGCIHGDVNVAITGGTVSGKIVVGGSSKFGVDSYNISMTVSGKPDLSGVRIINAGSTAGAESVVMDLGEFKNGGKKFTAYYNETDYTHIIPAPAPTGNAAVTIISAVAAAAVIAAVVILIAKKKKKQAPADACKQEVNEQ